MSDLVWCELEVAVPADQFELVAELFQENGAGGVVFEDPAILSSREFEMDEILSEELKQNIAKVPAVKSYFPVDDRLGERINHLKQGLRKVLGMTPEFTLRQLNESNWADAWKQYYKPEKIGKVIIKPSWEDYSLDEGEVMVALDPGMAFGTGNHPSTRLCVRLLQELISGPLEMLDLGTGSGILAITAAKLGAGKVIASDIDPVAVKVATENTVLNGVDDRVTVIEGNLIHGNALPKFDLVVANIIADIIVQLAPDLDGVLKSTGRFVASGIINHRLPDVEQSLKDHNFKIIRVITEQEWCAVIAAKNKMEASI